MNRIRRCGIEDIPALLLLEQCCFAVPWSEQALQETLRNPIALLLAEEEGNRITGYLGMYLFPDGAEIARVAVDPSSRRRGTGTRLVSAAVLAAEKNGAKSVWLEVRCSNNPAQILYEKCGFREDGRRKNYYSHPKEDAILMTRVLQ
ncbi:MAG: ribosomal protein S18-alanine N-acetyltransferase [Clostridia bacterium]|nr:ribosomal protein S18-alanine N-acetyltransferase [Clostridia bacterium]MBO4797804.1 ribosomal protein S18-alanine N-acetyltransferase [Candidatus Methanomethylophilaceae archaeon]MBQ4290130.1 ribosomal protein S18-alanine N-acetyltransferase [Clostridia bacterium]